MTSHENGQEPAIYRVVFSEQTKTELKHRHREAMQRGIGQQFLTSIRRIVERLRTNPLNFGEPQYRLPALKLLVCQAVVSKLVVDYAVHEDLPLVFIREIRVLS